MIPAMPDPVPPTELIGNQQVRHMCGGVTRHTLLEWRRNKGFPEPVATIDRTSEVWDRRAVRAWLREREREKRRRK